MDIGRTVAPRTRRAWRTWLARNHAKAKEVWLVMPRKGTGRGISYNDAVDEALCFGWIDSIVKKVDDTRRAQRFTPRRKGSPVSAMNAARVRRLMAEGRMTDAGLDAIEGPPPPPRAPLAADVRRALQADAATWRHYRAFPLAYRAIRIAWIEDARGRPDEFRKRLRHFVRMTRDNRRFGMVRG